MNARQSAWRRTALVGSLTLVAAALATMPATASGASSTVGATTALVAATGTQSVTLVLKAAAPALVKRLATTSAIAPSERAALLARAVPTAATRTRVRNLVTSHGLTISTETAWSITAAGPASAVAALVGSRLAVRRLQAAHPNGSLSRTSIDEDVPTSLRGLVTGVLGGDDRGPRLHPLGVTTSTPASLRSLYHGSLGTPTGSSALTIATIQFSGWNSGDLTAFAADHGLPDPVRSGQYVAVSIGGQLPSQLDNSGGNQEVALDQETLLAMSPKARQRAYFAPNSGASNQSFVNAIHAVAEDAPASHIAALSISWGACEAVYSDSDLQQMNSAITAANAAGVTVFAASGDSGAFDCGPGNLSVDYPASDPAVVAVGGTRINGTTQTAWSPVAGDQSASGGGESRSWPRPAYQPKVGGGHRLVPDLAAEADPDSGLLINVDGGVGQFGGTSLAAPLTAALFTNSLADHGWTSGIGNVLPNLYAAPASSFTDITSGNNGHYVARAGYDQVTGLGAPLWDRLRSSYDGAPTLTARPYSASLTIPITVTAPASMAFSLWRAGVGSPPAPRSNCDISGGRAAVPRIVTATADGPVTVWVLGYSQSRNLCYSTRRTVVVDRQAPVAHPRATSIAPGSIWSANPLRVTWNWTDGGSGVDPAHCTTTTISTTTGAAFTVKATCRDRAGNLATAPFLAHIDRTAPSVIALGNPSSLTSSSRIAFRWSVADSDSGIASTQFRWARASQVTGALGTWSAPAATSATGEGVITGQPGYRYCLQARAIDKVGNATGWSPMRCATVPLDDRALSATAGWQREISPGWMGGTSTVTTLGGQTLTSSSLSVGRIGVVATTCPTCGSLAVYVGTTRVGTLNLQAPTTTDRALVLLPRLGTPRTGSVRLVTVNNGHSVRIDALAVSAT